MSAEYADAGLFGASAPRNYARLAEAVKARRAGRGILGRHVPALTVGTGPAVVRTWRPCTILHVYRSGDDVRAYELRADGTLLTATYTEDDRNLAPNGLELTSDDEVTSTAELRYVLDTTPRGIDAIDALPCPCCGERCPTIPRHTGALVNCSPYGNGCGAELCTVTTRDGDEDVALCEVGHPVTLALIGGAP